MMKQISKRFFTGLIAILPVVVTLYLLYWLAASAEVVLGRLTRFILPNAWYWPGMGLVAGVLLVFLVGLLMQAWVIRRLVEWAEEIFCRVPLIKTIYGAIRDFLAFISRDSTKDLRQVVAVTLNEKGLKMVGFMTRNDLSEFPREIGGPDRVAVFLPLSYQIGGYTVTVPRSAVEPLNMPMEEATRFVLTAGIAAGSSASGKRTNNSRQC